MACGVAVVNVTVAAIWSPGRGACSVEEESVRVALRERAKVEPPAETSNRC